MYEVTRPMYTEAELRQLIIDDYKAGENILQIANKYRLYRRAVHDMLKQTIIEEADKVVPHKGATYNRRYRAHGPNIMTTGVSNPAVKAMQIRRGEQPTSRVRVVITPEVRERIKSTYSEVGNIHKTAIIIGVSYHTVRKVLHAIGVPRLKRWGYKSIPDDVKVAMVREYKRGKSLSNIAKMFDSNYQSVRAVLRDANVSVARRGQAKIVIPAEVAAKIASEYRSGVVLRELSERYGYTVSAIRKMLVNNGVTMRSSGPKREKLILPPHTAMALGVRV